MLNPKITKDNAGVFWLEWTPDPTAEGYAITTPSGASRTFNPAAKKSKLGKHAEPLTATVGALDVTARAHESATYPPVVPPPTPTGKVRMEAGVLTWDTTANATGYVVAEVRPGEVIKKFPVGPVLTFTSPPHPGETDQYDVQSTGGPWYGRVSYKWPGVVVPPVDPPPVDPPPTGSGELEAPPGYVSGDPRLSSSYPGYEVKNVTNFGKLDLNDSKDYFLKFAVDADAPTSGSRQAVYINGGRNVVAVGGYVRIHPKTSGGDAGDCCVFIVDDGNPAGIVSLEGVEGLSANGLTIRTKREVRLQATRLTVQTFGGGGAGGTHSDGIQWWDRGPSRRTLIRQVTVLTDYTAITMLMEPNATRVDLDTVWMVFQPDHTGPAMYFGNGKNTVWTGVNVWFKGGKGDGCLDDSIASWGETNTPYRITRASDGAVYVNPESPGPPAGGNSPFGKEQGDKIDYPAVPNLHGLSIRWGTPPGGDPAPLNKVGSLYVPKGYA